MTRRLFLLAFALSPAALMALAGAQQSNHVPVVGLLMISIGPDHPLLQTLRKRLRELGYVDGQNIRFEFRGAQGQKDRLPDLAQELARLKVDVIEVRDPNPINPIRKESNEQKARKPLRFGSRLDVSTAGNWE